MKSAGWSELAKTLPAFFVMGFVGWGMAALSWQKWPDLLIDFGRELYIPWRLSEGATLYQDVTHFNGPLSAYFNAMLFKIFGTGLMTIAGFNLALIGALTWLIYNITRQLTDRLTGAAVGTTFLVVFAFSQYVWVGNYNFVTPYSHEIVHGIFLSFLAIHLFMGHSRKPGNWRVGSIGFFLGLVFLTKMEVFVALLGAIMAGFFLVAIRRSFKRKELGQMAGILSLAFLLPSACFILYFSFFMPAGQAAAFLIAPYRLLLETSIASNPFYLTVTGRDAPFLNLMKLFLNCAWYGVAGMVLIVAAYLMGKINAAKLRLILQGLILGIFFFSYPYLASNIPWLDILRPLPFFLLVIIGYLLFGIRGKKENSFASADRLPSLIAVTLFSFLLLLKMILNVHVYHYGFALAMPATLLASAVFLYHFPRLVGNKMGHIGFTRIIALVMVGTFGLVHFQLCQYFYNLKTFKIQSRGDEIITWDQRVHPQGMVIEATLAKIEQFVKPHERIAVFPDGVMLNYLTRRPSSTSYYVFLPPEILFYGEDQMLGDLQNHPPDYVLLFERNTSEFGYRYFGRDYGLKLFSWIQENYETLQVIGAEPFQGKGFGVQIAKKKPGVG